MKNLFRSCATMVFALAASFSPVASAIPILSFSIDGNTAFEPFNIHNQSTNGEYVTAFHLDISSTGACFDVTDQRADACPGNAANGLVEFGAHGGTGAQTGLVPPTVNDGDTVLDFLFTDFAPGESLSWFLDVDFKNSGRDGTVDGNHLIGSLAWVDFSSGERLFGMLGAVGGNGDASAFTVIGRESVVLGPPAEVPLPSTLALLAIAALGFRGLGRKRA